MRPSLLPPGLYKQLSTLKDLISEYRENPDANAALRGPILENLNLSGLQVTQPRGRAYVCVCVVVRARGGGGSDRARGPGVLSRCT